MCEWCRSHDEVKAYNDKFDPRYPLLEPVGAVMFDSMVLKPVPGTQLKAWGKTRAYKLKEFKWAPDKMPDIDDSWVDEWLQKYAGKGPSDV